MKSYDYMLCDRLKKYREKKQKERSLEKVYMPVPSFGVCINRYCSWHKRKKKSDLGSGYCQKCYDKGLEKRYNLEDDDD